MTLPSPKAPTQQYPNKATVGMVLDHPFPPDSRVSREARTLAQAGHKTVLLCAQPKHSAPMAATENYHGVNLLRIDAQQQARQRPWFSVYRSSVWASGILKNVVYSLQGIDAAWQWAMEDFILQHSLDVLHVHDLRLVPSAVAAVKRARKNGHAVTLVADLHEFYPALIRQLKGRKDILKGEIAYQRWLRFECNYLPMCDWVWVIDEASKQRLLAYPNQKKAQVGLLPNVVSVDEFDAIPSDPEIQARLAGCIALVYAGHINHTGRGLQCVIEALPELLQHHTNIKLVLAGATRPDYEAQLIAQAEALGVSQAIIWTGELDDTGMAQYIQAATVCLCPTVESDQTNSGIPNKIFQYALYGKPQVVSSAKPQTRWVESNQCGLSFASGNVAELTQALRYMLDNPDKAEKMGEAGRKAVLSHSSWEAYIPDFLQVYQR